MGIVEHALRKAGLQANEEKGEYLSHALDKLAEIRSISELSKAVQALAVAEQQQGQQQENPVSVLRDLGLDLKGLFQISAEQARAADEKATKMTDLMLQTVLAMVGNAMNNSGKGSSDLETVITLAKMFSDMSNATSEKLLKAIEKLQEEKKENQREDPIQNALMSIFASTIQSFVQERLVPPRPADPLSQVREVLETARAITGMVPQQSSSGEYERMRLELEKMKLDYQMKMDQLRIEEEQKFRREIEQKRLQLWEQFTNHFSAAVPLLIQYFGGGRNGSEASSQAPTFNAQPAPANDIQVICTECGNDFIVPSGTATAICPSPTCGAELQLSPVPAPPEVHFSASQNGITKHVGDGMVLPKSPRSLDGEIEL